MKHAINLNEAVYTGAVVEKVIEEMSHIIRDIDDLVVVQNIYKHLNTEKDFKTGNDSTVTKIKAGIEKINDKIAKLSSRLKELNIKVELVPIALERVSELLEKRIFEPLSEADQETREYFTKDIYEPFDRTRESLWKFYDFCKEESTLDSFDKNSVPENFQVLIKEAICNYSFGSYRSAVFMSGIALEKQIDELLVRNDLSSMIDKKFEDKVGILESKGIFHDSNFKNKIYHDVISILKSRNAAAHPNEVEFTRRGSKIIIESVLEYIKRFNES